MTKDVRKKRTEYIYGTTKSKVDRITVSIDEWSGEIFFGNEMVNTYSEISYHRPKKPKIITRIPQKSDRLSFESDAALRENYDVVCAIDTNTISHLGNTVSAVGVLLFRYQPLPSKEGLEDFWKTDTVFCVEITRPKFDPEKLGWVTALEILLRENKILDGERVGVVTDHDLGNINALNSREIPILEDIYIPQRMQFIYASVDVGKENIANRMLSAADSVATQCLNALKAGILPANPAASQSKYHEGVRRLNPKNRSFISA
ncbi:hypothetical protein ACYQR9_06560 [Methylobacterium sp. CM6241]